MEIVSLILDMVKEPLVTVGKLSVTYRYSEDMYGTVLLYCRDTHVCL